MTNEINIDLAKKAVASPHWRWMAGMRVLTESGWAEPASTRVPCSEPNGGYYYPHGYPDLTDPATLGCLLALVREAYGSNLIVTMPMSSGTWGVAIPSALRDTMRFRSYTEAEALVGALEAAP